MSAIHVIHFLFSVFDVIGYCSWPLLWSPPVLILCWCPQQTGASLWQNHRPAGHLERSVSALCGTNGLVSTLYLPRGEQPLFHSPHGTVCVSGHIQALLPFCVFGSQRMRRDGWFGGHVFSCENRCTSSQVLAQCGSLCMLLLYVSLCEALQCVSGFLLHLVVFL